MKIPQIVTPEGGFHNKDLERARGRLLRGNTYRDVSTVIIVPAISPIPARIVQAYMGLMTPMNQKVTRIFVENMEVGDAYQQAIEMVINHPELSRWSLVLTLETDNAPPPDGLLKLIQDIYSGPWAAVGGLYWTKGEGGMPMCYGKPAEMPRNFAPWLPPADTVTECNGLGMGFTLWKMEALKDPRLPKPLFRTVQEYKPGVGAQAFTQDLWAFNQMAGLGYRFACSTRVLVGHWDQASQTMW